MPTPRRRLVMRHPVSSESRPVLLTTTATETSARRIVAALQALNNGFSYFQQEEQPWAPGGVYCLICDEGGHLCEGCGSYMGHGDKICPDPTCVANE